MAKTLVGLEITEESVRAVEVSIGRRPRMLAYGEVPLPPEAAKDSEVLDQDAVALALRSLWAQAGIRGRNVTLGVGSRRVLVREYSTPAMAPHLIKQALPFQVQDLLPVPVDQAVLDFYPIGEEDGTVTGLLVAAVAETIEDLIATANKAKLHVDAVDLAPFGLARAARVVAPDDAVAMIHIGEHTTYVVIAVAGIPRFVRILPVDLPLTPTVTADAATELETIEAELAQLVPAPAAPLRSRAALRAAEQSQGLDPDIIDLLNRLRHTLAFYANRPGSAPLRGVFLSGVGATLPPLVEALGHAAALPVQLVGAGSLAPSRHHPPEGVTDVNLVATLGIVLGERS